ncbi:hypothetical protein [Aneurinibacillus migulanus]|uniref:Uncharacterized protein n=1 Tax=Aneurinibacillus migulanus TaxID=47500 RepID=A0A0D1UWW5_ANEMI|nr:hypothetical protein [Aneurinibacillus migulanus]KIV51524.1 hypothetical protein TS65_27325 [Aneurinibacillus migulanus]KON97581.1 hypothetical protein AF333_21075 [Aneurinibacillus migulanus]MED0894181.1 hypothetical protein [Aneurinibacillus migulanus]MED1619632.1 hypothetical protein [Aneurinibacillus migulanus]SDK11943.1 hypothetical protein SAMN04487909_13951 [Aneurinibacillus migulanus]
MLTLKPLNFIFKISTTDLELVYIESGGVRIEVGAIPLKSIEKEKCVNIEIIFSIVAEVKCVTLNFDESDYNGFCISEELSIGNRLENDEERLYHPDSGFYEVIDSKHLQENIKRYDPRNRLNLKHYIVKGYDSYIELIASTYSVNELN